MQVSRPKKEVTDLSLVWEVRPGRTVLPGTWGWTHSFFRFGVQENFPGGYTSSRKEFEELLGDEAKVEGTE